MAAVDINVSTKRKIKAEEAMPLDHRSGKENEDKKGGNGSLTGNSGRIADVCTKTGCNEACGRTKR